jgi:ADP-heptose:LPS heptosyltransferase
MKTKVVGFNAGLMGDIVMNTVVARSLKASNPDVHLTMAVGKPYAGIIDLLRGLTFVDSYHVWSTYDKWPMDEDREYISKNKFDYLFNPFPQHSRSDWYNHFHYVEEVCNMNRVKFDGNFQCELGYRPINWHKDSKYVTLSLFASGNQPEKSPSKEVIQDLCKRLLAEGYLPIQVGYNDPVIEGARNARYSLTETMNLIKGGAFHISVDCGLGWCASAYKFPVIGLYGVNYSDMPLERVVSHNPCNPNAQYINAQNVSDITVDVIIEQIKLF